MSIATQQLYEVFYRAVNRRMRTVVLEISSDTYDRADAGDEKARNEIALQYFETFGFTDPQTSFAWSGFQFTLVGQPVRAQVRPKMAIEVSACACKHNDRNCTPCEQYQHGTCRLGCKLGQPIMITV